MSHGFLCSNSIGQLAVLIYCFENMFFNFVLSFLQWGKSCAPSEGPSTDTHSFITRLSTNCRS